MTRKDYEKFAKLLRETNPALQYMPTLNVLAKDALIRQHAILIEGIAAIFAEDNVNFKKQKFINAIVKGK